MPQDETKGLELRDYLRVLGRHKWIMAVTLIVCLGAAFAVSQTRKPSYTASASVLMERGIASKLFDPTAEDTAGALRRRANEVQVLLSPAVVARVAEDLGRAPAPVALETLGASDVVRVIATGRDPKLVAATANTYAETYIDVRRDLNIAELEEAAEEIQRRIDEIDDKIAFIDGDLAARPPTPAIIGTGGRVVSQTDFREVERAGLVGERDGYEDNLGRMRVGIAINQQDGAQIIASATPPTKPNNDNPSQNLIAGLALGIVLAIALAFLREYLDDTVKSKDDLETASGLTAVGIIPALSDWKKRDATPLVSALQPRSPAAEAYRTVRTSVEFLGLDQPIGSIQVTSALASEGKTSTLANLAVTFARAGQRVIVLCCDLRRPRVHEFFGLSNRVGFTSVLLGDTPLGQAIQPADRDLPIGLVASGPLPPNPAELLSSKRAVDVIEDLDRRCDLLLIDSPPILPVSDSLVISGLVDGVLFVANAGTSTKRGTKRATELLRQVDAPLIGAILNGVGTKLEYGYTYGGDNRYYLDTPDPAKAQPANRNGKSNGKGRTRPSSTRATR